MTKAIECAGYVLAGVTIAVTGVAALIGTLALIIWASKATAAYLGYPENMEGLFGIFYFAMVMGAVIGAITCWSNR